MMNGMIEETSDDMNFNEKSVPVRMAATLDDMERAGCLLNESKA